MSRPTGAVDIGTALRATLITAPDRPVSTRRLVSWVRTAPHPDHPFSTVSAPSVIAPSGQATVNGVGDEVVRRYRLPAGRTVAATPHDRADVLQQWAEVLVLVHRTTVDDSQRREPPSRERLRAWWSRPDLGNPRRNRLRDVVLDGLERRVVDRIDDVLSGGAADGDTLVHGWATTGHSVLDPHGRLLVLTGEDCGHAPVEFDLGALCAEQIARSSLSAVSATAAPSGLTEHLLARYTAAGGRDPNRRVLADHAVEHLVRHVADLACFADVEEANLRRWTSLINASGLAHERLPL